jgi:hypothetical protein
MIKESNESVSFSRVINDIIRKGLTVSWSKSNENCKLQGIEVYLEKWWNEKSNEFKIKP